MDINYRFIITFLIIVMNYVEARSQSISIQGSGEAIQGEEYTLECITRGDTFVNWYQDSHHIAWSSNHNGGCRFYNQYYRNFYEFKNCGVKHKLTIKSIDYNRDNGKVWNCEIYYNDDYHSSNSITLSVTLSLKGSGVAIQDKEYTLECKTSLKQIHWYKDNIYFGESNIQNGLNCIFNQESDRNFYEFKNCGAEHKLTIKSIDYYRDNGKVWRCYYNQYTYSDLTIHVIISLKGSGVAIQDKEYTLECKTSLKQIHWYKDNIYFGESNIQNGLNCIFNQESDRNFYEFKNCGVKHKLTIKSIDYYRDNGKMWRCQYFNIQNFNSNRTLFVRDYWCIEFSKEAIPTTYINKRICIFPFLVPVSSVQIKSTNLQFGTILVEESQLTTIQCVTSFAYPEPSVDLHVCYDGLNSRCNSYTATKSSENHTLITFQFTLNSTLEFDDTEIYCCAGNYLTNISCSNSLKMYILHHPRVRVEVEEGRLLCIAVGRPKNMTFLPMKHTVDNILVREIEGYYINTTVYSLNITNSQNNGGNYTCTVNNGIPDPYTKQYYQMAYYNLELKIHPNLYNVERNNNSLVGQNGSFSLKYLEDQTVNVSWYNNDTDLQTSSRITIREEPAEISHPYNNTIKLSGIKTILTITSINITDQGNYTCQVCNQYGCSRKTFEVDVVSMTKQIGTVIIFFVVFKRRRTKLNGQSEGKREGVQGSHHTNSVVESSVHPNLYNVERNNNSLVGQNGSFSLKYLEDQTVNVSWYNNDTDLQTSSRITIREEPAEISHPYNNTIKLSGIKTILTITSINITDQGNYTCQVCNQYGCSRKTFEVDVVSMTKQIGTDAGIINVKTVVIGASVGATIILICIVVIIFFVVFKRRRTKPNVEMEIIKNDLYISSDPLQVFPFFISPIKGRKVALS
ncbi:hypothetical protein LOTGIDRAFT_228662 [Lottia gigantea]|uniref:Ig-like domain-containing protein n=1 Tax=Lottia gigantea TaxID=225164 RepID=V4AFS2_LOTGI|nr:hypothetical protein LOTGIDRAFT_228662 [Lottia gigantea]ESO93980.1 hypothetical protein LOTGIDRAFT_228662 [Lottia gigantea]